MARQRVLDDRETQARAPGFARAAPVHPVEALGEAGNVLGLDADAGVLAAEFRALRRAAPDKAPLASGRGVAHGVACEVAERAGDLGFRPDQVETLLGVERDPLASGGERDGLALDPRQQQGDLDALVARRLGRRLER